MFQKDMQAIGLLTIFKENNINLMPTKMQRTYVYQYCAIVEKMAQAALLKTKITNIIFLRSFA